MNYTRLYHNIVNRARQEFISGMRIKKKVEEPGYVYYEGHHVVPKCLGGLGSSKDWNHSNIVPLTPKEHFLAHKLLVEIYPDSTGIIQAFCYLSRLNQQTASRKYQDLRSVLSENISNRQKGKKRPGHSLKMSGDKHFFFGKKRPEIGKTISRKLTGNSNATKKVVDTINGTEFSSVNEAALHYNVNPRTITRWVNRQFMVAFI